MSPNKGKGTFRKILIMKTFKFVKGVIFTITKSAIMPNIWLIYI